MNINITSRLFDCAPWVLDHSLMIADAVKNEPMLFNCDIDHAYKLGGPITRSWLDNMPEHFDYSKPVVIDTRVHMLMPGWYPCIPGWHHDDVERSRSDGQPNYIDPSYRAEHIMSLVNGNIAPTKFAVGAGVFNVPEVGETIYSKWDEDVDQYVTQDSLCRPLTEISVPSQHYLQFDDRTWHKGSAAVAGGWRWFGRISRFWTPDYQTRVDRPDRRANEVRSQVQVYMPTINAGW